MPVIVSSKRDCSLVWKFVEYTFNHQTYLCEDVRCERSKLQMQVKIGIRFHSAEGTCFEISRLSMLTSNRYAKESPSDKSSSIKQTIYQKLRHLNEVFLVLFHIYVILSPQYCCFRSSEFNNILLCENEGEETQSQEHRHPCPALLEFHHSSHPFCKNHKKT